MLQTKLDNISKYLTEDVLDRAFKLKTGSQDVIKTVDVSRAAPAGTGLLGAVYRIKVYGDRHIASFVAKGMVQDPLLKRSLMTAKYFKREIEFFATILPALINVQKTAGGNERLQNNVPVCYGCHTDGQNDYILMEDLSENLCAEISENSTKSDLRGIFQTMAHMHALSIAFEQRRPEEFKQITKNIPELYFSEDNRAWYAKYLKNAIDIDLKTLSEFEEPETSDYYKKFAKLLSGDPYGVAIRVLSDSSRRSVIAHGDAWYPNFLRSKSRTVAIDFQLVRHASPVTDVAYFLLLSKQCADKENALEAFKVYHEALTYYLNDVGIDANQVYSWEDFNTDLKLFGKFGLIAASTSIPLLCSERCDVLQQFDNKYSGVEKIPLEELWQLSALKTEDDKMYLVNAVRLAVDIGLI
ncbi:hypothetical protein O0L34_g2237 [Tuta absoluta]|nr:hypothetical protein O0L34_g2237 [Tuta absoluta]